MKIFLSSIVLFLYSTISFSQTKDLQKDTTQVKTLDNVAVTAFLKQGLAQPLPPTKKINVYPSPGILLADGGTFYVSLGVKI